MADADADADARAAPETLNNTSSSATTIAIQRLGFFRPLFLQENYIETLRAELQTYLRYIRAFRLNLFRSIFSLENMRTWA